MAILEPKQVAHSDFSAGLRAFESGANMVTNALDKLATMPGEWQKQMRQYRENEAAQAIMSARNMEDILARSRAAAEAGATAYNPEGIKNLALLANTQLIANNQAAEERVQREFGDYQARIIQARNNGDRALENKLLNEYVAKRNQASQESGLDYNQLKFGQYDYQANDLQRANLGLQRERLRWEMHQGLTEKTINNAKAQAFADSNYDPNNSTSVTAAWNEAINYALSTQNPDAVAKIINEATTTVGYKRSDPTSMAALQAAQDFLTGGRNTPTSSNTPEYSDYNRNLALRGALSDQYATSASSSGLTAASFPASYPASSTSSGSSSSGDLMAGAAAIRSEIEKANQAQQAKEKEKAGKDAELQAAINVINNRQDGIARTEKGEPVVQQQPALTPQQQAQKQAMQAADAQLQAISSGAGSSENVMLQAQQEAAKARKEAEENFTKAAEQLSQGQQNFQQALNQSQPQTPVTQQRDFSQDLVAGGFINTTQQKGINKFLQNSSDEEKQTLSNLALAAQSDSLANKQVVTDLFGLVAKAGEAGEKIDFSDYKSVINALLRFERQKYQVAADPFGQSQSNATAQAGKNAKLYVNAFNKMKQAEQNIARRSAQVDQAAITAFSANNLRISSDPVENQRQLTAQQAATGSIKKQIERANAINTGAIRNNPLMRSMAAAEVAAASGQPAEDIATILVENNLGEDKDYDRTDGDSGVYKEGGRADSKQIFSNDIRKSDTYFQIESAFNTAGLNDYMRAELIKHYAPRLILESSDGSVKWDPDTVNEMLDMVKSTKAEDILADYRNLTSRINQGNLMINAINNYEASSQAFYALNDEGSVVANNVATALPDTELNAMINAANQGDLSQYRKYATMAAESIYRDPYTVRIAVNSACFKFQQYAKSKAQVINYFNDIKDQIKTSGLLVPIQELNDVR